MEHKIGEIFEYNGEWYQCVEQPEKFDDTVCALCDFHGIGNCALDRCSGTYRSDKKHVIFKKLEKIGEPITVKDRTFQCINAFKTECTGCVFLNSKRGCDKFHYIDDPCPDREIWVEIKQTSEDMEEKNESAGEISIHIANEFKEKLEKHFKEKMEENYKAEDTPLTRLVGRYVNNLIDYDVFEKAVKELYADKEESKPNLKPFDLEAAKAGKPVCTRDGRKARIICFDRKLFYRKVSYPILALVERSDGEDDVCGYNEKGKVLIEDGAEYKDDLMMLPEKKEGWVNLYKSSAYSTKEEAMKYRNKCNDYIDTINISWEE